MSELKLEGKIVAIMEKKQVTDTFATREFVIETDEQYPQMVKFQLTQAKCEDIDNHKVGDELNVHFNMRGRKWTNRENEDVYFISANAWRLEALNTAPTQSAPTPESEPPADSFADDLPF